MKTTSLARRGFLKSSFGGLAAVAISSSCKSLETPRTGPLASTYRRGPKGRVLTVSSAPGDGTSSILSVFDWDTGTSSPFEVRLPFAMPHSVVPSKSDSNEFFVFEVFGRIAKVDVASGEVTMLQDTTVFSHGHGLQPDGRESIFCTELKAGTFEKYVSVRSAETLKVVDSVPRELGGHHIIQIPKTPLLVCSSPPHAKDGRSRIYFYDHLKRKIVRTVDLDYDVVHMAARENGQVIGVCDQIKWTKPYEPSASRSSLANAMAMYEAGEFQPAPAFVLDPDSGPRFMWDEKHAKKFRHGFGISLSGTRVLTTYMDSDAVIVWKDGVIEKTFEMSRPQLATFSGDGREFMIVDARGITIFSTDTFEAVRNLTPPAGGHFHIINPYT